MGTVGHIMGIGITAREDVAGEEEAAGAMFR
jgi:hypothetical protein